MLEGQEQEGDRSDGSGGKDSCGVSRTQTCHPGLSATAVSSFTRTVDAARTGIRSRRSVMSPYGIPWSPEGRSVASTSGSPKGSVLIMLTAIVFLRALTVLLGHPAPDEVRGQQDDGHTTAVVEQLQDLADSGHGHPAA